MHESVAIMRGGAIYVSYWMRLGGTGMITGMKTEGFQKNWSFERRSEVTLLVSLSDFVEKIYKTYKNI